MANTTSAVTPKIIARMMLALRQRCSMPQLVNGNFSNEAAQVGATIDVPFSSALSATAVVPGPVPPTPANSAPTTIPVSLDQWYKVNFHLTDKEGLEIAAKKNFLPGQMIEAIKALSNTINISILSEYKRVWAAFAATSSGNAMASRLDPIGVRRLMNINLCPLENRRFMLDFEAEANALALAEFADVSQSADAGPKIKGIIGEKYGYLFGADDHIPTHTAGTGASYQVNNGAGYAAGTKTIAVDVGTGTLLEGDILTFSTHEQTYVVTTALSGGSVSFEPGLAVAVADNVTIAKAATHIVNLAFHKDAWAFAMRPMLDSTIGLPTGGHFMQTVTDPVSGMSFRLEVTRQYKQTMWEIDALWGTRLVRPDLACRLMG